MSDEDVHLAVERVTRGTEGFAADMREQGIHVGLNGVCVTCGESWPCAAEREGQ